MRYDKLFDSDLTVIVREDLPIYFMSWDIWTEQLNSRESADSKNGMDGFGYRGMKGRRARITTYIFQTLSRSFLKLLFFC